MPSGFESVSQIQVIKSEIMQTTSQRDGKRTINILRHLHPHLRQPQLINLRLKDIPHKAFKYIHPKRICSRDVEELEQLLS